MVLLVSLDFTDNCLFVTSEFQVTAFLASAIFLWLLSYLYKVSSASILEHEDLNWSNIIILHNLQKYIWPL